ncbi:hypothetical protein HZC21_00910 [Candidatus Peregrinibacteria bacterium]|nr:hypothetical protein [Candidatus Peregrinibacteria bacterium]
MNDSSDSGRHIDDEEYSAASEIPPSERPHLDQRRETLDQEIGEIIERFIANTGQHEPVGSALESITEEAFKKGYGRDALIKRITELGIFKPDGIAARALRQSIEQEIETQYACLKYDRVGGELDKTRRQLVSRALKFFLEHMGEEDCITSFFKNLIEGRYKLPKPLLTSSDKQSSVSKRALLEWALSPQTLSRIASRMNEFVKPVIAEAYKVYIEVNPHQYVRAVFNNVIGIDEDGGVKIYFNNMDELIRDVRSSVDFETFWEELMSHKDLLAKEYHDKFPGQRFYTALIEGWREYLQRRWNEISGEEGAKSAPNSDVAPEVGRNGNGNGSGVIKAARTAFAARAARVCSTILPPGPTDNGGSGSKEKARVILTLLTGQNVGEFFVKTGMYGNPSSLRDYIRGKLIDPKSGVAETLRSNGIRLEERANEIDTIVNSLIAAGSRRVEGVRTKRFPNGRRNNRKRR